jgi:hypothetical protein
MRAGLAAPSSRRPAPIAKAGFSMRDRLHAWGGRIRTSASLWTCWTTQGRCTCSRRSSQACCDGTMKVPDLMENSVPARPVYVQRGKTHIGTCDEDRRDKGDLIIRIVLKPSEELRNAIDLIIVTTVWK